MEVNYEQLTVTYCCIWLFIAHDKFLLVHLCRALLSCCFNFSCEISEHQLIPLLLRCSNLSPSSWSIIIIDCEVKNHATLASHLLTGVTVIYPLSQMEERKSATFTREAMVVTFNEEWLGWSLWFQIVVLTCSDLWRVTVWKTIWKQQIHSENVCDCVINHNKTLPAEKKQCPQEVLLSLDTAKCEWLHVCDRPARLMEAKSLHMLIAGFQHYFYLNKQIGASSNVFNSPQFKPFRNVHECKFCWLHQKGVEQRWVHVE